MRSFCQPHVEKGECMSEPLSVQPTHYSRLGRERAQASTRMCDRPHTTTGAPQLVGVSSEGLLMGSVTRGKRSPCERRCLTMIQRLARFSQRCSKVTWRTLGSFFMY